MPDWVVIPAKQLDAAKTRLAPAMSGPARAALVRGLLSKTIAAACACPGIAGTLVVSADEELRAMATGQGALAYPEPPAGGLDPMNAAAAYGCRIAATLGATGALVLPGDLPLLIPHTITTFLEKAGDAPVAIAPDRSGTSTNALLLRPPLAIVPAFGPGSLLQNQAAALAQGLGVTTISLPRLAFDLDTPDDLARLERHTGAQAAKVP